MVLMLFRPAVWVLCLVISLIFSTTTTSAQTCNNYRGFTGNTTAFSSCNDLHVLNSFIHWTYIPANRTVHLAYRHTGLTSSSWIAWAINPTATGMVGSQALVAFETGGTMNAYQSPVTSLGTNLAPGNLSFAVTDIKAVFTNGEMTIFATLVLPGTSTTVNQVWQEGPLSGGAPSIHSTTGANRQSIGTIDFQSGQIALTQVSQKRKNVHGVLNAVSWGTLMPLGAIVARYLKVAKAANPAWFYLHIACQSSAYAVGVAGWATGLKLGSDSPGTTHNPHRNIGIALFVLGTLQVFALLLRPKPDHKYRFYWNIYHHLTGYLVIIMSVFNVYEGFEILNPVDKWKTIYTVIIVILGVVAVILEAFTWMVVIKRKKEEKSHHGVNGANGYGARHQQGV